MKSILGFSQQNTSGNIVFNVKKYGAVGDGVHNDHNAFINLAKDVNKRKGNCTIIIPKGTYIVGNQIKNTNSFLYYGEDVLHLYECKNVTILGNNAIIKYKNNLYFGAFNPDKITPYANSGTQFANPAYACTVGAFLYLQNCSNITLQSIQVNGSCENAIVGGRYGDTGIQLPYLGIFIQYSHNIIIKNINIHHMGQDGIMIFNATPQQENTPNDNIVLEDSKFEYNGRQGLSWVGGIGLVATRCSFSHTGSGKIQSMPGAGVDIEVESGIIRKGIFNNCVFENNYGAGLVGDSGDSKDMQFSNCTFWGSRNWSCWTVKAKYKYDHCNFYGSAVHAHDALTDEDATKFINCNFEDKLYKGKPVFGAFLAEINGKKRMVMKNCTFISNYCKLFWFDGSSGWKEEEKPYLENCTFKINNKKKIENLQYTMLMTTVRYKNCTFDFKKNVAGIIGNHFYFSGSTDLGGNITK